MCFQTNQYVIGEYIVGLNFCWIAMEWNTNESMNIP